MSAPSWRYVSSAEQALAREVFGSALDAARVRMFCQPLVTAPFTPGSWGVVWPAGWGLAEFADGDIEAQGDFIHELTHVWQAQCGVNLILGKLRAGDLYDYDKPPGPAFPNLNIEQQARFVEHAFKVSRGWSKAPHPPEHYAASRHHWYRA